MVVTRAISLDGVPSPPQVKETQTTMRQTSSRRCSKCGKASTVIVLYRNDAAVDFCDACWAHMPNYIKARAANVVRL